MRIAAAILAIALAVPAAAQMTINVHVVEVPVTVVDRAGNPIRGLTAANFALFDDGKRQTITGFDAIDFAAAPAAPSIAPLNPYARRSFLLLFDLSYSGVKELERARAAATSFLSMNLQRRDLVAVGVVDVNKGFRLLTSFTTDRRVVAAAIAHPMDFQGSDPLQLSDTTSFDETAAIGAGSESTGIGGGGRGAEATAERAEIQAAGQQQNRDMVAQRVLRQVDALGRIADVVRSMPGRKQVVLLSAGFDASVIRGRPAGSGKADLADFEKAIHGAPYAIDSDARFGSTGNMKLVSQMAEMFKRSDVVMNAIDVGGLHGSVSNDSLHLLADPTGGHVFENANDLRSDFDRMMRAQEVVYVLSFQATAEKPGKLHELTVKTVDVPGARVNGRNAYAEATASAESAARRTLTNAEIIVSDIPQPDIGLAAVAAPIPAADGGSVPLFVEINGDDLLRGATLPATADVFVYAFGNDGTVGDRLHDRITVTKDSGIKYFATLSLPPGHFAVKVLVVAGATQKRGFTRVDVDVTRPNELAVLPPLFRDSNAAWTMIKGSQHAAVSPALMLDGEAFVPKAAGHIGRNQDAEFLLLLFNVNPADMLVQAITVTDASGVAHPAAIAPVVRAVQGDGVAKVLFRLHKGELPDGRATLQVSLRKKDSSDVKRISAPLMIGD